jgi:uncharacterized protein (DUF488 family)
MQCDDPVGDAPSAPRVYTLGHGARSAPEFLDVLHASAIDCVVDVRTYPASRRHPQFSQKALAPVLDKAGIGYRWVGKALGGFRQGASSSIHTALATDSLRAYAEHMNSSAFQEGIAELLAHARLRYTVMLCTERLPQHCHRAMISDYLTANGVSVIHILERDYSIPHRLNILARWVQGQLIYDQGGRAQLEWEF